MPLVEQQVEHLARPVRSKVSPKEKKVLTSKVKIGVVQLGRRLDGNNSVPAALGLACAIGVAHETEVTCSSRVCGMTGVGR